MIYRLPAANSPIDQGDLIDGCPLINVVSRIGLPEPYETD